jgi:2-polyprenyl-6-hydroxyphenyl methylase/3-demethylubiquinone-9 3-methyltransferase
VWHAIKKSYNRSPNWIRYTLVFLVGLFFTLRTTVVALITLRRPGTIRGMPSRGMSRHHDLVDWVGGYPFEVAKPEEVFYFLKTRGFRLEELKTCGPRLGCNEFVARLEAD